MKLGYSKPLKKHRKDDYIRTISLFCSGNLNNNNFCISASVICFSRLSQWKNSFRKFFYGNFVFVVFNGVLTLRNGEN